MADNADLYGILGVQKGADADDIKKAYRKLARQYHPDRNPDDASAEARFKEISAAHAVLSDDKKRKLYDEFGPDGLREGFNADAARQFGRFGGQFGGGGFNFDPSGGGLGGFGDLDDILGGLFGGAFGGRQRAQRAPRKGRDVERQLTISLRQAIEGGEVHLPAIGGNVRLPKGVADGQRIRLTGKGHPGPGGPGDLYLSVQIALPPGYDRDGDDLSLTVPVTVGQAIKGGKVEVPTAEGTVISLNLPAGSQGGRRMRLRGKGLPQKGGQRGNFYIELQIRLPQGDDPALIEAVDALEAFYPSADGEDDQ